MSIRKGLSLLLIVTISCLGIIAQGQSNSSNGEKIRLLRAEIKKRETIDTPDDVKALNRSRLVERRAELRTLLLIEIGNLQKYRSNLGVSSITPEENEKVETSISEYQAELRVLSQTMQEDLAAESAALPALSSPEPPVNAELRPSVAAPESAPPTSETMGSGNGSSSSLSTILPASTTLRTEPGLSSLAASVTSADCEQVRGTVKATQGFSELDKIICGLATGIQSNRKSNSSKGMLLRGTTDFFQLIKIIIARKNTPGFLVDAEDIRMDKQVGGAPSNAGSTSLVTKGGAPAILGFAVENGGLTRDISGSAVTFRGNPVGLINALSNKGFVPSVKAAQNDPILNFLTKTSFAFTFNTDRGPQPGVLTASKQQLSSFSSRIELINKRRPELYIRDWEDFIGTKAQKLTDRLNIAQTQLLTTGTVTNPGGELADHALQVWFEGTQTALSSASDADVYRVLQDRLDKLPLKDLSPNTIVLLGQIESDLEDYVGGRKQLLEKINSGTLVTFEYLNKREVNAPDTSNFTFIAEKGTQGGKLDFTLNSSLTMFNNLGALRKFVALNPTLPQPRRVRDFQFAGQMDYALGNVRDFGQMVLFAGGRYERLLEDASTDLGLVLPNTKGDIGYLQLGVKVPIKGTGFKIPFSVTFANRSELVKERHVRGNFGFSLDLDTLFAKFKPF